MIHFESRLDSFLPIWSHFGIPFCYIYGDALYRFCIQRAISLFKSLVTSGVSMLPIDLASLACTAPADIIWTFAQYILSHFWDTFSVHFWVCFAFSFMQHVMLVLKTLVSSAFTLTSKTSCARRSTCSSRKVHI